MKFSAWEKQAKNQYKLTGKHLNFLLWIIINKIYKNIEELGSNIAVQMNISHYNVWNDRSNKNL